MHFRQSTADFPMMVSLGEKTPHFGLHRFNKGLKFIPPADEGFTMRGDKQRLLYKGRRQSHRFTILGDTAFEYDCILQKEPETNVISLLIEGADQYDFFRQPEFVKNPLLQGSYAVYKKEILIGEGTGKLCHIHRPQIIDARGRRCWGSLAVVGNVLHITIPEQWLGEAAYPVIVDPVIGTTTVGKFNEWTVDDWDYYSEFGWDLAVNRFLVNETLNGTCSVFAYTYIADYNEGGYGVIYSDSNNKPVNKISRNEEWFYLPDYTSGNGWGGRSFELKVAIQSGSYIWFGILGDEVWNALFDYGSMCYYTDTNKTRYPPDIFPTPNKNIGIKLSMFFSYNSKNNFVHKIYQGVKLTDKRNIKADYKKIIKQTVKVNSVMSKIGKYFKKVVSNSFNTMITNRNHSAIRKLPQNLKLTDSRNLIADYKRNLTQTVKAGFVLKSLGTFYRKCISSAYTSLRIIRFPAFVRTVADYLKTTMAISENRSLSRNCTDNVKPQSAQQRIHNAFRKVQSNFNATDNQSFSVLFVRSLPETATPSDKSRHIGTFIRNLLLNADTIAETSHTAEYYRFQKDNVQTKGPVFRGLLLFVHIVTKVFIRDYLLGRFLIAKEDLQLKSVICRELTLESKVN